MAHPISYDELLSSWQAAQRFSLLRLTLTMLAVFVVLQTAYGAARDTWVERLVIHQATVKPAAALVQVITPEVNARPVAASIKAPGGGINILNGCEGTEVLFLLYAAFAAAALPWRARVSGLLAGTLLVYVLNQGRILALFYAYRSDKALFDLLHGTVAPLILIVLTALFFLHWLDRHGRRTGPGAL